jgi:hypothetical protein
LEKKNNALRVSLSELMESSLSMSTSVEMGEADDEPSMGHPHIPFARVASAYGQHLLRQDEERERFLKQFQAEQKEGGGVSDPADLSLDDASVQEMLDKYPSLLYNTIHPAPFAVQLICLSCRLPRPKNDGRGGFCLKCRRQARRYELKSKCRCVADPLCKRVVKQRGMCAHHCKIVPSPRTAQRGQKRQRDQILLAPTSTTSSSGLFLQEDEGGATAFAPGGMRPDDAFYIQPQRKKARLATATSPPPRSDDLLGVG